MEYFNSKKKKILEYLNNYKVKLNVSIPPLTCTDLDKNYNIEEFEVMNKQIQINLKNIFPGLCSQCIFINCV